MRLYYEWIYSVVSQCTENSSLDYVECYTNAANDSVYSIEESQWWLDKYITMICQYHSKPETFSEFNMLVYRAFNELGKSREQICELMITILTIKFTEDDVEVYRNGHLYRRITNLSIVYAEPPTGIQTIHFNQCFMTEVGGERMVMVSIDRWTWRFSLADMPDEFKRSYATWLRFQNIEVPSEFTDYIVSSFNVADLYFEVDLDKGELMEG